ncbi:PQQ-dependent sugar dehydrogenase [Candidatus Pelagibacter sp.]|nr:PQQ-dependent sugar dehydrogenase [Candidatus Pelagibacter sp.]
MKTTKSKFFYFIFIILVLFLLNLIYSNNLLSISKYVPNNLKNILKKTIFIVPNLKKKIVVRDKKIKELEIYQEKNYVIWKNIISKKNLDLETDLIEEKKILINNKEYIFKKFYLFSPDYYSWGQKAVSYIESYEDKYLIVTGDGNFYYFDKNNIKFNADQTPIEFKKIRSDLNDFLFNEIKIKGKSSIKDIFVDGDDIYISHSNLKKENCYNIEILKSKINFEFSYFENFFTYDECIIPKNLHSSGGRIEEYKDDKLLFSIGEGLVRELAQNKESIFGKIISIDKKSRDYKIISMGHRNPQGLFYDIKKDLILSTEHGPSGGDEINIIKTSDLDVPNYGWPISSYGNHYRGVIDRSKRLGIYDELLEVAPLHKSHKNFGYIEPIKYFTPSIGISEITKIENLQNDKDLNQFYLLASMGSRLSEGDKSLHYFQLDKKNKITNLKVLAINERVRDLFYDKEKKNILMILENTPALGIINIK